MREITYVKSGITFPEFLKMISKDEKDENHRGDSEVS